MSQKPENELPEPQPGDMRVELVRLFADHLAKRLAALDQPARARSGPPPADHRASAAARLPTGSQGDMVAALRSHLKEVASYLQRRRQGNYQTDPYGMDSELVEVMKPFFRFLYTIWWRVRTEGLEHVPAAGRALLVANHSGVLPWDGSMITTAVIEEHPSPRMVRNLFLTWFNTVPILAPLFTGLGQVVGVPDNAVRLLEEDELVCTFPEGERGMAKPFQERYRLTRFGRHGFVKVALQTGAPIIPVAIVGAEEIYPLLHKSKTLARLLGIPFFPITPFFPWLGILGLIPLPTRWSITFCPPISTADYGPQAASDPLIVATLSEQVRGTIQRTINAELAARTSIF